MLLDQGSVSMSIFGLFDDWLRYPIMSLSPFFHGQLYQAKTLRCDAELLLKNLIVQNLCV